MIFSSTHFWNLLGKDVLKMESELFATQKELSAALKNLENGRAYLMAIPVCEVVVEDALEAFGYDRNGHKSAEQEGE